MKANIIGKNYIYFDIVELIGINNMTDYSKFINNIDTPVDTFENIIVVKNDISGKYYEIITGIKIPTIEKTFNPDWDFYPVIDIPRSTYRGNKIDTNINETIINNYINNNDNEEFRMALLNFINNTKSIKRNNKTNIIKKLVKKVI